MNSFRYYIPAALWFVFILFATLSNVNELEVLNWRNLFSYDKPIHMILFGMQAYLIVYARKKHHQNMSLRILQFICLMTAFFGAAIEYLQIVITTTRSFDYFDMIANAAGCVVTYFILRRSLLIR